MIFLFLRPRKVSLSYFLQETDGVKKQIESTISAAQKELAAAETERESLITNRTDNRSELERVEKVRFESRDLKT